MGRSKNSVTGKSKHRKKFERKERRKKFKQRIVSGVGDISSLLTMMFRIPLRDFQKARIASKRKWTSFLLLPLSVIPFAFAIIGKVVFSPIEMAIDISELKVKNVLFKVPALLVLIGVILYFSTGWWGMFGSEYYANQLRESLAVKMSNKDFDGAVVDFEKLIDERVEADSETYMEYVNELIAEGENDKVTTILAKLAPGKDGNAGIPEAHQKVVIKLVNDLKSGESRELESLKWHLDCSGEPKTIEVLDAWAHYWMALENDGEAIKYLRRAANLKPDYFIHLANLYRRSGDETFESGALADARRAYGIMLEKEPKKDQTRLVLSNILLRLGEFDECQEVLEEGHTLTNSPAINEACANFYVLQFDRSAKSRSFESSTELVQKAFKLSPSSRFVQRAFSQLYVTTEDAQQKASIIESLEIAAETESLSTKANFLLSVLMHHDGDVKRSLEYSERTYRANPESPPYNNNLAWQLSQAQPPQLKRARELANFAVNANPNNASYRDTLGTILFKLAKHKEAILELKKSLTLNEYRISQQGRIAVHEKLAECYAAIGFPDMAKLHKGNAQQARSKSAGNVGQ
jgi:tetratricopeptide (TPR) repeat protein